MDSLDNIQKCVDSIIERVGKKIILGTPLGAGKPNHLINEIYNRAKSDREIELTILTALTLNKPGGNSDLEKRFFGPFSERVFKNYPNLDFEMDRDKNSLPSNVKVIEFYYPAGKKLNNEYAQRNYLSSNFTHACRDIIDRGVNVLVQQVSKKEVDGVTKLSLSCNADTTLDIIENLKNKKDYKWVTAVQVNQDLPFMHGDACVDLDTFDFVVDNPNEYYSLFAPPKMPVADPDYMIGLYASTLIKDDGELQVGIGSLGDALVYSLIKRHEDNSLYREILKDLNIESKFSHHIDQIGERETFKKGLFCATEMVVDGLMYLYQKGILKKKVYDHIGLQRLINQGAFDNGVPDNIFEILVRKEIISNPIEEKDFTFLKRFGLVNSSISFKFGKFVLSSGESLSADINNEEFYNNQAKIVGKELKGGHIVHGGFFLGPRAFYDFLKELNEEENHLFSMKSVQKINQLYGHEEIDRLHRKNARFVNTCLKACLNGQVASDALDNGEIVSGVGGQYNFVSMAHALPDGRSILMLKSVHEDPKGPISNIVWNYGHCTIPRHLRDIVITEYGIASLRGKTDEEIIIELIQIADSRFQESLIAEAKKYKKLNDKFQLDSKFRQNYPQVISKNLSTYKEKEMFKLFPFGTDFTAEELKIAKALKKLKKLKANKPKLIAYIIKALLFAPSPKGKYKNLMERMDYFSGTLSFSQKLYRNLLLTQLD